MITSSRNWSNTRALSLRNGYWDAIMCEHSGYPAGGRCSVISFVLTILLAVAWRRQGFDLIVALQSRKSTMDVFLLQLISNLKSFVCVGIPIGLLIYGMLFRNPRIREKASLVIVAVVLAGLFSVVIKNVVREPRPYETDPRIAQFGGGGGYGFPSGHTLEAVASTAMICILRPSATGIICSVLFCSLIIVSGIYLGVHDPAEVAGGFFFGMVCVLITAISYNRLIRSLPQLRIKNTSIGE